MFGALHCEYVYSATSTGNKCTFSKLMPQTPRRGEFDQALAKLSPSFIKIHDQALAADTYGLGEIAGVGLRKALEFLVKDYCIRKYPDQADENKKTFLGTCIKKFVTDPNVSKCAERAAWLGNDETHYLKVWSQHDLEDLKRLIKLTVNWISNELLTEQYFSEMPAQ